MALRVREDGTILCAAQHPAMPGDTYLHDGLHYRLSVELGVIVTEPMEPDSKHPGRGGHRVHGQWWWVNEVPDDVVLELNCYAHSMDETKRRQLCESLGCDPEQVAAIDLDPDDEFLVGFEVILLVLGALHRKVDKLMADLNALQAAVDALVGAEGAAADELVALKDEVAQLTAGTITQEQIDAITARVTDTANALTQATEAAKAPVEPPAPPAEQPPAEETPAEQPPAPSAE